MLPGEASICGAGCISCGDKQTQGNVTVKIDSEVGQETFAKEDNDDK